MLSDHLRSSRLVLLLACALAGCLLLTSCVSDRTWAVTECEDVAGLPEQVDEQCREEGAFIAYAKSVQQLLKENVSPKEKRVQGFAMLRLIYGGGPTIQRACVASYGGDVSRLAVELSAREIMHLPEPRRLACLEGRRIDLVYRDLPETKVVLPDQE